MTELIRKSINIALNMPQKACLGFKEKLAVTLMLLLLSTFAAISYASKQTRLTQSQKTIQITCLGAIVKPQVVEIPCGVQVSDLLAKLELSEVADLSKLVLEERLKASRVFIIPTKGQMSLYVTGAVKEPGIIYVPETLHFNQLKQYLRLAEEADVRIFHRRRRQLCQGETVNIPSKSEYLARK
ncbi:MAG: hypothetical protein LLF94_07320 [Chlamydiales bacterium]|nr:hypothetical protein [Chlamydiales bacterium]